MSEKGPYSPRSQSATIRGAVTVFAHHVGELSPRLKEVLSPDPEIPSHVVSPLTESDGESEGEGDDATPGSSPSSDESLLSTKRGRPRAQTYTSHPREAPLIQQVDRLSRIQKRQSSPALHSRLQDLEDPLFPLHSADRKRYTPLPDAHVEFIKETSQYEPPADPPRDREAETAEGKMQIPHLALGDIRNEGVTATEEEIRRALQLAQFHESLGSPVIICDHCHSAVCSHMTVTETSDPKVSRRRCCSWYPSSAVASIFIILCYIFVTVLLCIGLIIFYHETHYRLFVRNR